MAEEHPARPGAGTARIAEADEQRAVLVLSGDLRGAPALRDLEELLLSERLRRSRSWVLELADLDHLGLACAYAVLRAVTSAPQPVDLTVRGAHRPVHRTLREAGIDALARFEH
ncbi:hypothetical protein ACLGIH_32335 [Streptomyces sp. HMX87]|uniref:hypothetical protein n=1 Tax=Streptomyces sp. HMX87 TaxID=3390849 RepID=UPI003A8672A5